MAYSRVFFKQNISSDMHLLVHYLVSRQDVVDDLIILKVKYVHILFVVLSVEMMSVLTPK
jgi:hypothetical protein